VAPFLNNLAEDCRRRPNAADHQIVVRAPDELGQISADAEKLTQVFSNLIDNGLKYTPKGARLELGGRAAGENGVEFFVSDNGSGIPPADLPQIFERFYRVDKGRSRAVGGTGLGLAIVKHIVNRHRGQLLIESEEGKGTTVSIWVPVSQATARLADAD
jgi:two-component system phosphate regulon sensor histidine kinase PhoR